jgi:3-oxoacyl-[acyl-carrier protein] reductase
MGKLDGKRALVTGASKGIGAGIARALAAEGATVIVGYSGDEEGAARTAAEIERSGGRALAIQADVSQGADVERMFARATTEVGQVDVIVNNASVFTFQPFADITAEEFHRQYNINVLGLIFTTQAFVAQAPPAGGAVINILSSATSLNQPGAALYTSTKGAATTLTRILAKELAPQQIRVNGISPGTTDTEGSRTLGVVGGPMQEHLTKMTPLGRIGTPEDFGPAAVFLASDDASWITGDILHVTGGLH